MKPSTTIKLLLLVLLTATITTTKAQTVINNLLTDKHVHITGTRVSIIPPKNFVQRPGTYTLSGNSKKLGGIVVMPWVELLQLKLTTDRLLKILEFNWKVDSMKQEFVVNGCRSLLYSVTEKSNADSSLYAFVLDVDNRPEVLFAGFLTKDTAMKTTLYNSLLSVVYDTTMHENYFADFDFEVDMRGTGFKLCTMEKNALVFSLDGKEPARGKPGNIFFVVQSKPFKGNYKAFKAYCISHVWFIDEGKNEVTIEQVEPVKVNGVLGYQAILKHTDPETKRTGAMHSVAFNGKQLYVLLGEADNPEQAAKVKAALSTFKLKQ